MLPCLHSHVFLSEDISSLTIACYVWGRLLPVSTSVLPEQLLSMSQSLCLVHIYRYGLLLASHEQYCVLTEELCWC